MRSTSLRDTEEVGAHNLPSAVWRLRFVVSPPVGSRVQYLQREGS